MGKEKPSGGKNDSSGLGSGETSGLRRSVRETPSKKQANSSPVSVRKSQRLETGAGTGTGTGTPPKGPSATKKTETQSPLRRSRRENKFQSPSARMLEKGAMAKSGVKQSKGVNSPNSKDKKKDDEGLKEVAEEGNGKGKGKGKGKGDVEQRKESPKVGSLGTKRKKRLHARTYMQMFKPIKKKTEIPDSAENTKSENCNDSEHSASGDDEEGQQKHCNGDELKEDCSENIDGDTGVSNSDVEKQVHVERHCESEDIKSLQVPVVGDLPSPSPEIEVDNDEAKDMDAECSVMEKTDNEEKHLPLEKELSNDGNDGSKSNVKETTPGATGAGSEGANICTKAAATSVSSMCKMSFLIEQCPKCHRKQRLDYNSPKQELCCCLSNSFNDVDMISVSKDRGECGTCVPAHSAEENGQDVWQIDPALDVERSTCVTCKRAGKLLHCHGKGCKRSYHPSCLFVPEVNTHLQIWYCSECIKKRLIHGVHSVSPGVESVLDVREAALTNSKEEEKQKQYFVKYKGLAHIHNHWVPEKKLRLQAPELLAKFGEKKAGTHWKPEWAVAHRLLQKRSLVIDGHPVKPNDQDAGNISSGQCEWLVKWCALDYDQATWETEDSPCFKTVDAQRLIRDYETRHERARMMSLSGGNETQEQRRGPQVKLGRLPGGILSGADCCYLNSVNKLREYYYRGQNALLLDEQDRIVKVIYLVSSVTNLCRPFLIITPHASLSFWEAEFLRVAASINVVAYAGSTDARKLIRSLEFFEEGGNMMLQVLLSSIEVISEDMEVLKNIKWGAVIVDDCQQSCIWEHSSAINNLPDCWRLLLVNARLKDDVAEYVNILSLLEPGGNSRQSTGLMVDSSESVDMLKERLSSFMVCARFLEYWVPVQLSNLQLEQYCSLILSNSTALCSCSKNDPVGSLRETLISARKCCDHPYIVDSSLQPSLRERFSETPLWEVGIRGSGKLQLLDRILSELRNQGIKVLILFQSIGGTGRDATGDILDDFLRLRFGSESYEHVECVSSRKQAALNKFNKERERSFFLLETRACLPSIKLSSLDAVIIFNSDWNPINDLRALQRITIDSKLEQVKVFRLYCSCTVEEKVLVQAKNGLTLDSTISPSTSHMLLMWGSSYLFTKLDDFHCGNVPDCTGDHIVPENSFRKDVCEEMLSLIRNPETVDSSKYISLARQSGGGYLRDTGLIGEKKIQLEDGVPPHVFWTKLLEGKQPQWKYVSGSPQRIRKRVHHFGESSMLSEVQADEAAKKRKKMDSTKVDSSYQQVGNLENLIAMNINPAFRSSSCSTLPTVANDIPGVPAIMAESGDRTSLYNDQRDLFQMLKPAIVSLCETLQLQDECKSLAEQFFEYVVNYHPVRREPETLLQAFQISVCWTAADVLKQKIDHRRSLGIAREKMNFSCGEDEANFMYSKMKLLIKIFSRRTEGLKISNSSKGPLATSGIPRSSSENDELEENSLRVSLMQTTSKENEHIKKVKKMCHKKMSKLKETQNEETEDFMRSWEEEKAELEKKYRMESAVIRSIHGKSPVGVDKLKLVDDQYTKEREELESQMLIRRKELEVRQQAERDELKKKTALWLEEVNSLAEEELLDKSASENDERLTAVEYTEQCMQSNGASCITGKLVQQNSDKETSGSPGPQMALNASEAAKNQVNVVTSEVPSLVTDKQKENSQEDATKNVSEALPTSEEAGANNLAKDVSNLVHLQKMQTSSVSSTEVIVEPRCQEGSLEQHLSAPTREMEKDTNQMISMEVNTPTALDTNQVSGTNTSFSLASSEPLSSPVISGTEEPTADPAVGASPVSQGIQVGSFRRIVNGAEERMQSYAEMQDIMQHNVTASLGRSYPVLSGIFHTEAGGLPGIEYSFPVSVIIPSHDYSETGVPSSGSLDTEAPTAIQGTIMPIQHQHTNANISGGAVSRAVPELAANRAVDASLAQSLTHTSLTRGPFPARASHPNPMHMPTLTHSRADPLENEMDRMRKELFEISNNHEEMTLRLKSERDKEIEKIVLQIHKKYDEKLKETEASFSLKKNELEKNQQKVMMHFLLAKAFRSKCIDTKASSGMQQVISPGSMEHSIQSQPAANSSSTPGNPLVSSPRNAGLPIRSVQPSPALPSSSTPRSPFNNPLAPTAGVQQKWSSNRAPAPHLQAFGPASIPISSSMPSVSSSVLGQQLSSNTPSCLLAPIGPPAALPIPGDLSQQHEINGSTQTLNLPLSATQMLLMEMEKQNEANIAGDIPPLPDNVRNSESWDISEFGTATRVQQPSSNIGAGNNVVCLSDDE